MDRRITIETIAGMLDALTDEDLSEIFWKIEDLLRTKKMRRRKNFYGIHKLERGPLVEKK